MRLALFALAALGLAGYAAGALEVRTDITDFLPHDAQTARLRLSRELSKAPSARLLAFTLTASRDAEHRRAGKELARALEEDRAFAWVRSGLSEDARRPLYELYFPARLGFLPLPEGTGPVPDAWLDERLRALRERLASPLGMLERRLAPEDPLGGFTSLIERYARDHGDLTLADGQLVTRDGRWSVVFAQTRASAFDGAAQSEVVRMIDRAIARAKQHDPTLVVEWTGVNRFALEGERSVKEDIARISTLSLVGIFLLYFGVFRSLREPLLVLLPIAFGCVFAIAVCQLAFGFVHGLTLAFGSSIIGVAEDYSTHFFAHRRAVPAREDNEALMKRLWPGMLMGGITTIVGVLSLVGSGFPGLVQMAVFSASGVLGALVCTRYVLPDLSRKGPLPPTRRLAPLGTKLLEGRALTTSYPLWVVGPVALLACFGLTRVRFEDGVSALRTPTPALDRENRRVQERLGRGVGGRAVLALGSDDEAALRAAERVRATLSAAERSGLVISARSPTDFVPSVAAQERARKRLADDPSFVTRFRAALSRAGFAPEAFASFEAELARPKPVFVTPREVLASPLADLLVATRVELAEGIGYLTPVATERSRNVEALFAGSSDAFYLDQEALFADAYARFRSRALSLLGFGLALVVLTLYVRYRSVSVSALGLLPALFGAAAALGVTGLFGVPLTFMHVMAVLLVLSMGVDYGIYVLESRSVLEDAVTTLGSVLLAALTTVLSFGALGMSDNPALSGIGVTVALGMVFTVLASPLVLALVRSKGAS